MIILLVCESGVIKSGLARQVCGRDLIVDITRSCLLEVLPDVKMFWQSPELFLIHRCRAVCDMDNRHSLDSLLSFRFYRCLRLDFSFVVSIHSLLRGAVWMVWGDPVIVVEGGCGQSGLKVRLLHPTLRECVLLVYVMFGSEWVAREDKFDHGLDLALSFLILSYLMFNIITDLGQFLFLLFFVRFDQPDYAFSAVLLRSITLILRLWLDI